jgi:23S rRNA (pseudouridine1915-N3)-methyltransferase
MPSKGRTPDQQCAEESERLLRYIERAEGQVYILDETGDRLTSPQFSEMITKARDAGTPMVFVLGGAYGFTDVVRKAGKTLRLSDMTLPHELCRVLFLEQLYRAGEIARGSQYHHA